MTQTELKARVDFARTITEAKREQRFQEMLADVLGLNAKPETPEQHVAKFAELFRIDGTFDETKVW